MSDTVDQLGQWWAAGSPETQATGVLDLDAAEGPKLTLIEPLPRVLATRARCPTLLGEAHDGVPLTLLHPVVEQQTTTGGTGGIRTRLRGTVLLRGVHADSEEAFVFARALVRFTGLRDLCLRPPFDPQGQPFISPAEPQRHIAVAGGSLTFRHATTQTNTKFGTAREQDVEVLVEANERVSLDDFEERWLRPLQSLIILASREPASLQSVTAVVEDQAFAESVHPAISHGSDPQIWNTDAVEVLASSPGLLAEPTHDYERPLVPFAALGEGIQDFISRWWDLHADLGYAAVFLMSAWGSRMYLENKLLNEMSFSESYHRIKHNKPAVSKKIDKHLVNVMLETIEDEKQRNHYREKLANANEQNTRERLQWLIERADKTLRDVQNLDEHLADRLVKARNALVHLHPTGVAGVNHGDLFIDIRRLELVIQTNLLRDLQLEPPLVEGLIKTSYLNEVPLIEFDETEPEPP